MKKAGRFTSFVHRDDPTPIGGAVTVVTAHTKDHLAGIEVNPVRCKRAAGSLLGGSTSWVISIFPIVVFGPTNVWAGVPFTSRSPTTKISDCAVSITGVPVMPTLGVISPAAKWQAREYRYAKTR